MGYLSAAGGQPREYLQSHRGRVLLVFMIYVALVIYGSLVTRQFVAGLPLERALEYFANISYRQLNADRRQDLLANFVLYVPFGFMASALLWPTRRSLPLQFLGMAVVAIAGIGLAVAVEFAQIWFKRTVSLNDLYAESIGVLVGIALWWGFGEALLGQLLRLFQGRLQALKSVLFLYSVAYLLLSLFPYDFALNTAELMAKWGGSPFSLTGQCRTASWCIVKPLLEFALALPVGLLLLLTFPKRPGIYSMFGYGLLFGLGLESLQALTISGRASLLSVLIRGLAFMAAAVVYSGWGRLIGIWQQLLPAMRMIIVAAIVPYLLALFAVNGVFEFSFRGLDAFWLKLDSTRFVPFYYHYFNSETEALISVMAQLGMYAPVGVAVWAWNISATKPDALLGRSVGAALLGLVLGATVWLGRTLFSSTPFADPTNIWLATLFSLFGFWLAHQLQSWFQTSEGVPPWLNQPKEESPARGRAVTTGFSPGRYLGWLLIAAACIAWANSVYPGVVLLWVIVTAGLMVRWPASWLLLLPVAIPLLDLGVLAGAQWFDELDVWLLLLAGGLYLKKSPQSFNWSALGQWRWAMGLLLLSTVLALVMGVTHLTAISGFNQLMLQFNPSYAVHLGRGLFYPLVFLPLIDNTLRGSKNAIYLFVAGMGLSVCLVIALIFVERGLFAGLLDFNTHYRVSAHFSSMNVGSQHIDAFLLLGAPFVIGWFLLRHRGLSFWGLAPLLVLLFYAVFVTYSRWTLAAFLVQVLGMAVCFLWWIHNFHLRKRLLVFFVAALVVGTGMVAVLFENNYMKTRFASLDRDAEIRVQHWQQSIDLRQQGLLPLLVGNGLGTYSARNVESMPASKRPGSLLLEQEGANNYLKLQGGGQTLYFGQFIQSQPTENMAFMLDTRGMNDDSYQFFFKVCENSLMYSLGCSSWAVEGRGRQWQSHLYYINLYEGRFAPQLRDDWFERPLYFSLVTPGAGMEIDIDNVSLVGGDGVELLNNGGFSAGGDFWLAMSDDYLIWHIENIAVHLFFELGILGLLAFTWLVLAVLIRLIRHGSRDPVLALVFGASIVGFLMIGSTGSLVDAPRLMMLFYMVLLTAACYFTTTATPQEGATTTVTDRL